MKRNSFLGSMILLATVVTCLFMACQKEQAAATDTPTASEATVAIVNGVGTIPGLITQSDADALRNTYLKSAGKNATQYIQFSIKDVMNYLKAMKSKYDSDEVYVNFGVYDAKTAPNGNKDYIGRTTVFFTVNNAKKSGSVGNIILNDDTTDDPNSLNHGSIYP